MLCLHGCTNLCFRCLPLQVSFPSGAQVTVHNYKGIALNVYVKAPEDDFAATQGLCGTFDGRIDNDLTGRDGQVHPWASKPDAFTESWR